MADTHAQKAIPSRSTGPDAIIHGALGWLFITLGCAAIAAATLIPAYVETLDIKEAREVEAIKARILAGEQQRYIDFHRALAEDDPILVERLAMTELRLKPTGTDLAGPTLSDPLALVAAPLPVGIQGAMTGQTRMRSIENELSRPDLKQRIEFGVQIDRPRRTRLIIAATGEYQPLLAGVGALLVLLGLWPRRAAQ